MLRADLARLRREGRLRFEADVPADAGLWKGLDVRFAAPLRVELELTPVGSDVWARGTLRGRVETECRRCLVDVTVGLDAPMEAVFRSGVSEAEAVEEGGYALPENAAELELDEAVREHVLLAVPRYALCREACRGLCPRCGARLNDEACECDVEETDERWAPLRRLKLE